MKRTIYLEKRPWSEALELFLDTFRDMYPLQGEEVLVEQALDRIVTSDVTARISSPHYDGSAMDGVAVRSEDTIGADLSTPKQLKVGTETHFVDTGSPLPQGFDAVIQIEDVHEIDDETIEIYSPVAPWHYVRRIGEDVKEGDLLLRQNSRIGPYDIATLLAGGETTVTVRSKPKFGVLPTGSELVEPGSALKPGDIIEFNSRMVKALITQWSGTCQRYAIVPDEFETVETSVKKILEDNDAAIIIAGSSAGRRDFTPQVVEELGDIIVHGVNVMPGKPVVLGRIENKPVIGLPGYPVSAAVIMDLFIKPLVCTMLGTPIIERRKIQASLTQKIYSKLGMEEFVRVTIKKDKEKVIATPLTRGAGVISSLAKADGILRIPDNMEGLEAGSEVEVELLKEIW
ncbi:MAG: molybdopterin molybdenumtransferase MoeA [Gemmatimonadota bacterium]|nr:MAG: molybdopterin molybdenumtransferase MoeA [Gemmatimonadota bacterium]